MTNFHGIYQGNCALTYVGVVLELRKLDFRGFEGQFDVKKANFRGLIEKSAIIGIFWLLEPTYDQFSWNIPWQLCLKVCWSGSRAQKVRF